MKKQILFLIGLIAANLLLAQVPHGISHQAVIRNINNELVANSQIGIQVSILQGSAEGEAVYVETHTPMSNANGLITYIIGEGDAAEGQFAEIDWSSGPYFLKTEADPMGGTDYTITGVTQFLSVPYALFAERVSGSISHNIQPPTVLALEADPIEEFSATINGIVNGEGFSTVVVFEWGTSTSYGNTVMAIQSPVTGSNDVTVHAELSGLQAATTYHYRIRATNAVDVIYSEDMMFSTQASIPQLNTLDVSDITPFSAVSGGNISYDGGLLVNERGIVWCTESNPTIDNHEGITNDGVGDGSFTSDLTNLSPQIFYYVRAYATNDIGTAYGNQHTFITMGQVPTVLTQQATEVTSESAVLNATVNPNHLITTVIFEWGLTNEAGNEVVAEQSPIEGSTNISVSALIDGIEPGTTYHFRVVAENELGVSYGEDRQFKTYDGTITDIDGNVYQTVIIGNQEWMAENLRVTRYNNEDDIPTGLSNAEWSSTTNGAYAIYNNDDDMLQAYGKLYNWYAVDDSRGLCPEGWSVPSDADWTALVNYVVSEGFPNEWSNPNGASNALKSCRQVGHPDGGNCDTSEHPRWNSNGTHSGFDEFGFSALPGGHRWSGGSFYVVGNTGYWWSATEASDTGAYGWGMGSYDGYVPQYYSNKTDGFSLRCFRDLVRTEDE